MYDINRPCLHHDALANRHVVVLSSKRKKHILPRIRRKVSFLHPFFLYPNGIGKGVYRKSKKIDSLYRSS